MLDEDTGDPGLEPSVGWSGTFATGSLDRHPLLHDLEQLLVAV
jgi:hypothetical protein